MASTITYRRYRTDGTEPHTVVLGDYLTVEADTIAASMARGAALALHGESRLLPPALHGAEVWVAGVRVASFTVDH